ncbi:hypothetical protein DPMN_188854 [Dreissena polymorpha]|uniref:Uncharacterized protein n=1 Tax=Dreissena polymorpha TaxID=45954 RepID=A0A9D4DRN8_DREPO|nr:hypothetical protein DPMN_188854 [Dreissena polymorpha]
MARQRPTHIPMLHIDQVNRCRNEEIIVKDNFGWVLPIMGGAPQDEIDLIVIRDVQYQFEVNRCRITGNEEIIAWPMWAGRPRIDCIVIKEVQYQFEVNRCINEDIVKGNFGWAWPMWAGRPRVEVQYQFEVGVAYVGVAYYGRGAPGLVMGPYIVEIDHIVIREVQYQLEVNRCRNEEIICGLLWAGRPRVGNGALHRLVMGPCIAEIDRIVIREVQYQFEVNRCRNAEIIEKGNFGWAWPTGLVMGPCIVEIDLSVIREAQYQFEVNRCRNEEVNDGQTDAHQYNIPTFSPKNADAYPHAACLTQGRPGFEIGPRIVEIDRIVIRDVQYKCEVIQCTNEEVNFQGSSANSVGGAGGQDGRTDAHQYNIPTFSTKNMGIKIIFF